MTRTYIAFLQDRTGSMESIRDDTIGAFNTYIETMQNEAKANGGVDISFTLLQFDSQSIDTVHKDVSIANVPRLTRDTFVPRASTPLIDACVKTIQAVEQKVGDAKDVKVIICFQTDGHENASTEHTWDELNQLIKAKTALGWQFNFMGESIDAYDQGAKMGIAAANIMSHASTPQARSAAYVASAAGVMRFASGQSPTSGYTPAEKRASGDIHDPDLKQPTKPVTPASQTARVRKPLVDEPKV